MVAYLCEQKQLKQIYFRSNLIRNEELCKLYSVDGRLKLDVVYTNPVKKEKGKVVGINTFDIETFNNNSMEVVGKYKNTENATDIKVTIVPNEQLANEQPNPETSPEKTKRYNVEVDPVVASKDSISVKLPSDGLFSSVDYVVASKDSTIESKLEKPKRHSVRVMPMGNRNSAKKEESIKVGAVKDNVEITLDEKPNIPNVENTLETNKTNNAPKDYRVVPDKPKVENIQEEPIREKEVVSSQKVQNYYNDSIVPKSQKKNSFLLPILFIGIGILLGSFFGLKSSSMFSNPKNIETAQNK